MNHVNPPVSKPADVDGQQPPVSKPADADGQQPPVSKPADADGQQPPVSKPAGLVDKIRGMPGGFLVGTLLVGVLLILGYLVTLPRSSDSAFNIFASLVPQDTNNWSLHGYVLRKGGPVADVKVWAVLQDARGYRSSPKPVKTNADGEFTIEPVPKIIAERVVQEVRIHAHRDLQESAWFGLTSKLISEEGEEVLAPGHGPFRRVELSGWPLIVPPAIFFFSILAALAGRCSPFKYGFLICVTFLLTALMIVAISLGLSYVRSTSDKNDVLSLGYASLFRGRYANDVEPEWLLSLTAPPEASSSREANKPASSTVRPEASHNREDNKPTLSTAPAETSSSREDNKPINNGGQLLLSVRGLGAPLWVLLLSVIGAALRTILVLVTEIKKRPNFSAQNDVDDRMELFVRHQFFILFAPLGAILVYQLLVLAEASTQPVTVALVSLGAGLTLTTLLDRAVTLATTYAQGSDSNKK